MRIPTVELETFDVSDQIGLVIVVVPGQAELIGFDSILQIQASYVMKIVYNKIYM